MHLQGRARKGQPADVGRDVVGEAVGHRDEAWVSLDKALVVQLHAHAQNVR